MDHSDIYRTIGTWFEPTGPVCDIVISSRIRLARNVAGFLFYAKADRQQREELLNFIHKTIDSTPLKDDLWYLDMHEMSALEKHLLIERHVISKHLAENDGPRAVALSHDESLTLMINEEDHLRIQVLASGLQLEEQYDRIRRVDEMLEKKIDYAVSDRYGYLTACPTNVGTGIRVSVMLHLPALKMTSQIEKVFQAAKDMHLAVRGLYGEGSEPTGDFYQLSNQTTLGKSEKQIIEELVSQAVDPIVNYERRAREKLMQERKSALEDKVFRALAVLQSSRLINSEEMLYLLSYVRLGIYLEQISDITISTVNHICQLAQPAHLQQLAGKQLTPAERDEARAEFIRRKLRAN